MSFLSTPKSELANLIKRELRLNKRFDWLMSSDDKKKRFKYLSSLLLQMKTFCSIFYDTYPTLVLGCGFSDSQAEDCQESKDDHGLHFSEKKFSLIISD